MVVDQRRERGGIDKGVRFAGLATGLSLQHVRHFQGGW